MLTRSLGGWVFTIIETTNLVIYKQKSFLSIENAYISQNCPM